MLNNKIVSVGGSLTLPRALPPTVAVSVSLWTTAELSLDSSEPSRPREGSGLVESYSGHILVEDASGARFYVHEYHGRRTFFRTRRYMLDTGEPVRRIDARTFMIEKTGEQLVRVGDD
jgi:hypothetical protein